MTPPRACPHIHAFNAGTQWWIDGGDAMQPQQQFSQTQQQHWG
eukprot:gene8292-16341_t